jgi:hypothetical protein
MIETSPQGIWVDESSRPSSDGFVYVIAAVRLVDPADELGRLRGLLLGRQRYLHWRDEQQQRRREIVSVINELRLDVYVACSVGVRPKRQEQARSACLASVVREAAIDRGPLPSVLIEGRGRDLDRRDEYTVQNEARDVLPGAAPLVSFVAKSASPMLWVADAISSMASAYFAEAGGSDFWWRSLHAHRLTIRRVEA